MESFSPLDQQAVTALRVLAIDQVEKAASGHPGLPLGAAPMAYVLFSRFLRFHPQHPRWPDRDRFVLSAGHGSALLYALLHLFGYPLPLEELQRFRQWGSKTPGHPEYGLTPGVETTTGPLGQGLANAVGMAIAERHLAARFNRPGLPVVDHRTFVLASDGDLMEGISHEAAALAGHLGLGKLVVLYDDNRITIEGPTSLAWCEDVEARFAAYGWLTLAVEDGNDLQALASALAQATAQTEKPVLIRVRTHIGFGSPHKQDTAEVHGAPLGPEEHQATRQNLRWPYPQMFFIPQEIRQHFQTKAAERSQAFARWQEIWEQYEREFPQLAGELQRRWQGQLPPHWEEAVPSFPPDKPMATREASGKVLNALAGRIPELLGGSADLAPSNNTLLVSEESLQKATPAGRNLHFGVREHAMAAIASGLSLHGGLRPYVATFLVFSDYLRPALRLAALMKQPVVYVFTHDSIGLGEDGPTHQPVEHLPSLRAIPNLWVLRPADANETAACWRLALARQEGPCALILSRQKLPVLPPAQTQEVERGAYVLSEAQGGVPQVVLWATGSEVHVALGAQKLLEEAGIPTRVVSAPCLELYQMQPESYRRKLQGPAFALSVAIEAACGQSWPKLLGREALVLSLERFGASAPGSELFRQFGFTPQEVARRVQESLARRKPAPVVWTPAPLPQASHLQERLWQEAAPRLLARDPGLWGPDPGIAQRLGFLDLPWRTSQQLPFLASLVATWAQEGVKTLVLLGMGGSSLAPRVLQEALGSPSGRQLQVVDTTDPVLVSQLLAQLDPSTTAVLAVSKSGTTVETESLLAIFRQRLEGLPHPQRRLGVLTEPASPLAQWAREQGLAALIPHPVDVGGRFAALSAVGILPALWLGQPAEELLQQGAAALDLQPEHPAFLLAAGLAAACQEGWARLLLWPGKGAESFLPWLEQLVAESTGKGGKGVLPLAPASPQGLAQLPAAIHLGLGGPPPFPGLAWPFSPQRLGEAFVVWELATAFLGFLLGINPFDEPNVGEAKRQARQALQEGLPPLSPTPQPGQRLAQHLASCRREEVVVFLAFLPETTEVQQELAALAKAWQEALQVPVAWAFGPRYLHSTGQLHKGGPAQLRPVVLTAPSPVDLPIPDQSHTLGQLRLAQALGDVAALAKAGRPVCHVHLSEASALSLLLPT